MQQHKAYQKNDWLWQDKCSYTIVYWLLKVIDFEEFVVMAQKYKEKEFMNPEYALKDALE